MESSHTNKPKDDSKVPSQQEHDVETQHQVDNSNFLISGAANNLNRNQVLQLQRTIGNQATMRLLQSQTPDKKNEIRRVKEIEGTFSEKHVQTGNFFMSDYIPEQEGTPVIIELMESNINSIKSKINQLVQSGGHKKRPIAFVIMLNKNVGEGFDSIEDFEDEDVANALAERQERCLEIVSYMEENEIAGGCVPMVWANTSLQKGGYTFPFLEARASATLHTGVRELHNKMYEYGNVVIRSADADISNDPLLTGRNSEVLDKGLELMSQGKLEVLTGGYDWKIDDITAAKLVQLEIFEREDQVTKDLLDFLQSAIAWINYYEHETRQSIFKIAPKSVYYPEPNTYMSLGLRQKGAEAQVKHAKTLKTGDTQMRESSFYVEKQENKI